MQEGLYIYGQTQNPDGPGNYYGFFLYLKGTDWAVIPWSASSIPFAIEAFIEQGTWNPKTMNMHTVRVVE